MISSLVKSFHIILHRCATHSMVSIRNNSFQIWTNHFSITYKSLHNVLNQSSRFIRISSAHVDLIRNLMIHLTLRQIISDLVQSCHQITLSHFKTYRINCHFYESFHFMTIHSTCVVFLVVTAAHTCSFNISIKYPIFICFWKIVTWFPVHCSKLDS